MEVSTGDVVLCEFYFSDLLQSKKRPVLVLKDNLPFDDFIAIPISSRIENLHQDEQLLDVDCFVEGAIPKPSKLILRKTFVVSKSVVLKRYGSLSKKCLSKLKQNFCTYFNC
ncbi:type II toxin-antitoxin system PemK/MazF family toxin [Thiomicrospira microaerophila]|jgi:mRNA interferase MazF|uniref:type II toxin-antitoxin system PemK/MazF family toxin n=1 Tax=Thiomicrospira microaerophila TaxID=406020 RepID=UPI0005C8FCED|nr:type II toxin-antitoxin system PemK/MazF family toxin [Thiomicrospira microaerophila]